MQQHFRIAMGAFDRICRGRRLYIEALNPYFGFFYTVKKTVMNRASAYQQLRLMETDEFGKVLLIDNITQVAQKNEYHYHEPMVHPALCSHPRPETVLVIGAGDGGIIREVLKYPCVKRVELVELDGDVIAISKKHFSSVHRGAFSDPRVRVTVADGRRFTEEHAGRFDIVIMDITDPSGPSTMLYTREFFRSVRRAFKDRKGVFVMHTESPLSRPGAFTSIQKTLRSSFSRVAPFYLYIQMYAILWSITLSSDTIDPRKISAGEVDRKLARYGIRGLKVYDGATHVSMQTAFPYIKKLLRKPAPQISDRHPGFPDDFIS